MLPARVIVNSRMGTVVIGSAVRDGRVAYVTGDDYRTSDVVSPVRCHRARPSSHRAAKFPSSRRGARMRAFNAGVNLDERDRVRAVNCRVPPLKNFVAILDALKEVGALRVRN